LVVAHDTFSASKQGKWRIFGLKKQGRWFIFGTILSHKMAHFQQKLAHQPDISPQKWLISLSRLIWCISPE